MLAAGLGAACISASAVLVKLADTGAASFASFGAVFGDTYIKISGLVYVTSAQGTKIVEDLHSKL